MFFLLVVPGAIHSLIKSVSHHFLCWGGLRLFASVLIMISLVSLFVIFHVVYCSFEYMPTTIFLPTDKLFNFQPGIPTYAIKHVDVYEFLFHSKIFARPFFPCSIIMPVPHRIILAPICKHFSVRQFFIGIFYVGDYCSLGTVHSNSSMHAKYSTLMSTVPLVLTIQIQACTPPPFILCWCLLLFPWYWPFKFKHAYTHQNFMSVSSVPLVW